jgi:hypothetical protein
MFKKILIGTLAAILVAVMGANAYSVLAAPASQATTDNTAGLLYMYGEEKLARDVYTALYTQWNQPTFQNIAASEQMHMDAVKTLLVSNGITVPDTAAGVFTNATLQSLYTSLMATGSKSLADALKVGATIEEVDIKDLQSYLALTTNADIQLVYNNLMNGSYNHLRNFVTVLNRLTDEIYQPQYLSTDLYQTIITSKNGRGMGHDADSMMNGHGNGTCSGTGTGTCTGTGSTTTTPMGGRGHRGGR